MNENSPIDEKSSADQTRIGRTGALRVANYWFKLVVQPALAILFVLALAWLFGYAQRSFDWFNDAVTSAVDEENSGDSLYACSMLCVFVKAPGRCPVCGMELQVIEAQGDPKDLFGVVIEPTARRLANIKTVPALNLPISKEIEVFGKIAYDETSEATIAAYVDGRITDLLVDFTGAKVKQGEPLAVLYSPDLYSDQVGLLNAKKLLEENLSSNERTRAANQRLYQSARRRLVEFGLSESQIDEIEKRGEANSRIQITAPESGTCIKKLVNEGDYIKTGMPILELADLSTVWLLLEMFPEDTSQLRLGQEVTTTIQSQVGKQFQGSVSFIEPVVNRETNTVTVRVEIPNQAGLIKIGDYGRAQIQTRQAAEGEQVVVPRESVLINGADSVAYVETEPGRFEFRKVEIGQIMGDKIALVAGIQPGEMVAASGVFMLDSTFNIQGKVSLIDPNRAARKNQVKIAETEESRKIAEAFSQLNKEDRQLAETQVICPVMEMKLGSAGMGPPIRVELPERDVMICCEACRVKLTANPEQYYMILEAYHEDAPSEEERAEIEAAFAPLTPQDKQLAEQQVICPVTEVRLGTMGMGTPIRVNVNGTPVMICCEGCRKGLLQEPEKNFQILKDYHAAKTKKPNPSVSNDETLPADLPQMDLPQMDLPQMDLPQMDLPQMDLPKMELPK